MVILYVIPYTYFLLQSDFAFSIEGSIFAFCCHSQEEEESKGRLENETLGMPIKINLSLAEISLDVINLLPRQLYDKKSRKKSAERFRMTSVN